MITEPGGMTLADAIAVIDHDYVTSVQSAALIYAARRVLVELQGITGQQDRVEPRCGSWPLGWNEGESTYCRLPRGHDGDCRDRGGQWRRVPERTPKYEDAP